MKQKLFLTIALLLGFLVPQGAKAWDFLAVAPTGQTLYYTINGSTISGTTVTVSPQNSSSPYYNTYLTGNLEIPSTVTF